VGDRLADRCPAEYVTLTNNTYLWEPLRFHGLYDMGELPAGQLSCVGFVQLNLDEVASLSRQEPVQALRAMISAFLHDSAPACPDVLVLPELALPGPLPSSATNDPAQLAEHFRRGAIALELVGHRLQLRDDRGAPLEDDDLLLLLNADEEALEFKLPGTDWQLLLDTAAPGRIVTDPYFLSPRSLALLVKAR